MHNYLLNESLIYDPFLHDCLTDAANDISGNVPQSAAGHVGIADEANLNECSQLLPLEIVFRQGPRVLNRIQLRGVCNIEDAGYSSLLEVLLDNLAVVNLTVIQEKGDFMRLM